MTSRFQRMRPCRVLPALALLLSLFLPSESSAFIRRDLSPDASFLAAETCGNDPVNNFDPLGLATKVYSADGNTVLVMAGDWLIGKYQKDSAGRWIQVQGLGGGLDTSAISAGDVGMMASEGAHGMVMAPVNLVKGTYDTVSGLGTYAGNLVEDPNGTLAKTVNTVKGLPAAIPGMVRQVASDPKAIGGIAGDVMLGAGIAKLAQAGKVGGLTELADGGRGGRFGLTSAERLALLKKHEKFSRELLSKGRVMVQRGQMSGEVMSDITRATGREVGLYRMPGQGQRMLVLGDGDSVGVPQGATRVIAHTHPSGELRLSLNMEETSDGIWKVFGDIPTMNKEFPEQKWTVILDAYGTSSGRLYP